MEHLDRDTAVITIVIRVKICLIDFKVKPAFGSCLVELSMHFGTFFKRWNPCYDFGMHDCQRNGLTAVY